MKLVRRYLHWLHGRWPAGRVEALPVADARGETSLPGVFVAGDLRGVPLLKFAADSGARAVSAIAETLAPGGSEGGTVDIAVLGAGVAGASAALEARKRGFTTLVVEPAEPFFTIANFPKGKPIFAYPPDLRPAGELRFEDTVKESLLEGLRARWREAGIPVHRARAEAVERVGDAWAVRLADGTRPRARRVIVALGRSGHYRRLGVPGEGLPHVTHRLHDPADHAGRDAVVVGGGDSAVEAAVALAEKGARVLLCHRGPGLVRPKPENVERLQSLARAGKLRTAFGSEIRRIDASAVLLRGPDGAERAAPASVVFVMVGREAPLEFFRRSGLPLQGESRRGSWAWTAAFVLALALLYDWKAGGFLERWWAGLAFPAGVPELFARLGGAWGEWARDRRTLIGTVAISAMSRSFYYTLAYSALVGFFGWRRVRRRPSPYVRRQTAVLFLIQLFPLFLLPEIVLPWMGYNGAFTGGWGEALADGLFEKYIPAADYAAGLWPSWGHPRAYWRAYGFVLAFPLNVYNVFTDSPHPLWLAICFVQTFALIPWAVYLFGKGAYCGWVCSCGALAETLGDAHRSKMPHGPLANRWNALGQFVLAAAAGLLLLRVAGWVWPGSAVDGAFRLLFEGKTPSGRLVNPLSYKWAVDVFLAGVVGVGLYFKWSGRVWCRFACPLAALMHVYARFGRFRIWSDKKKCISCNVCTSVCHQGIDVMSFANKGEPLRDPQCVRCSACVGECPTEVLAFGREDPSGARTDRTSARYGTRFTVQS